MHDVKEILGRIYYYNGFEKDLDFCEKYNVNNNTLSGWKKRGNIPQDIIMQISKEEGLSLDWLLLGKGEQYLKKDNFTILDVNDILKWWMDEQQIQSIDEFATFMNLRKKDIEGWIKTGIIPFSEINRYKHFKSAKFLKNKNKYEDLELYTIKKIEVYGSYVKNMEVEGGKTVAENILEKYDIEYEEVEGTEFIYNGFIDKNHNNVTSPLGIRIKFSAKKENELLKTEEILDEKISKIQKDGLLNNLSKHIASKLENHIADKEIEIIEAFRNLPSERQEAFYHKIKYEAIEYKKETELKAV